MFKLFSSKYPEKFKVKKGLEILGLDIPENDSAFVLNEISKYVFNTKQSKAGERVFDLELDFKYYYTDFKKMGIDLNVDKISWWEFDTLLEGVFLSKNSVIGQVIQYRTYKTPPKNPKTAETEENRFYLEKKRQYALPNKNTEQGFEKLWKYVEKKAGDINE